MNEGLERQHNAPAPNTTLSSGPHSAGLGQSLGNLFETTLESLETWW